MNKILILAIIIVFVSQTSYCDNLNSIVTGQALKELQKNGFDVGFSMYPQKLASVSLVLMDAAKKRLYGILAPDLLALFDKNPTLVACFASQSHPDGFVANIDSEEGKILAFISEFYICFMVLPKKPTPIDKQRASMAFDVWGTNLLRPLWQAEKTEKDIDVLDNGDFFLVRKKLYDENGNQRFMAWTKAESINLALNKAGHWLFLKLRDISPDKCASWPAGFRLRIRGSWFTSSQKDQSNSRPNPH